MIVTKEFSFEAAHFLPDYVGCCFLTHGHSYKLFVSVKAGVNPNTGMVVDFKMLKEKVEESLKVVSILEKELAVASLYHHQYQNLLPR